jgi:hypothetical protein
MSIISSKPTKKQVVVDPLSVLLFLVLVLALLVFAPEFSNMYDSIRSELSSLGNPSTNLSAISEASFASDLKYWDTYCTHGWSADAVCEAIVSRTQSCSISIDSTYCSQYDKYLQQFRK